MRFAVIVASFVMACGGGKPAEPEEPETEPPAIGAGSGSAAVAKPPEIGPEIDAFHTELAKRWHAVGTTRMSEVCAAVADLQTKLAAVHGAGAPGGLDDQVWANAIKRMKSSLDGMKSPCGKTDAKAFESSFNELHLAFHDYMDLVVGDHGHGQGDGRGGRRGLR